jgi:hypothetical protein
MRKYQTIYKDKFGIEKTEIISNGSELNIQLRGLDFSGRCFELLEGKLDKMKFEYEVFNENQVLGDLTNCNFIVTFPVTFLKHNKEVKEHIQADIVIGERYNYGVKLILKFSEFDILNTNRYDFFEDALINIQDQLPNYMILKTCLSCRYSHYHPLGNAMYGGLFCFKAIKEKMDKIKEKNSLLNLYGINQYNIKGTPVQETFDCDEHNFISENDFNYSNWKYH